jgi:hypothetical protein
MNKWQIICPVVALLIAMLTIGIIHERGEHRGFIRVASHSIGDGLIAATNSSHLVRVSPELQARLSELLAARTHLACVLLGDEPPPMGDGSACSRVVFTNDAGQGLLIRLRQADQPGLFQVLGFRSALQ